MTNGRWLLPDTDNRLPAARRFRDLCEQFSVEAGGGELSEPFKAQIRSAALLALKSEQLQAEQVRGERVNEDAVIRVGSELRRALAPITARGEARKPAAGPDLKSYIASRTAAA